ncbi:MAG: type IV secretion system protein, partial [Burkholderiales bacterium]|nr:type IV secretion system protein [Burkholderiales bacterium]
MKKSLVALTLVTVLVFTVNPANATGIPVVDAALATLQQQNQVESIEQMVKQYQQLVQQYNQSLNLYSNFTGSRGLGTINYNNALRSLLPADQVNQMSSVADKGLSALSSAGKAIYDKFNLGSSCEMHTND